MSKVKTIKLTCPECGEEFEFDVYESVNVTLDKDLKEKVIDGSLFAAICPKCGHLEVLLHPFLYHDMDQKFMIQLDSYANLLDFREEFVVNNKMNALFPELVKDIQVIGVTSMADMVTTITAIENGLDWRVAQMALLFMEYDFLKYCNDNKKKIKTVNYSCLIGQKNENGDLIIMLDVGEKEENEQFFVPLPMPVYEHCAKEYKERLDLINPFIFDKQMREHFCNFYEEYFPTQEEHKNPYVYVERKDGSILICDPIPTFLEDVVGVGSTVLIDRPDNGRDIGRIKRIVDWNFLCISVPVEYRGRIASEYHEFEMTTTADSDAILNQEDLVRELIGLKERNYKVDALFPLPALDKSNMFICSMTTAQFNFKDINKLIEKNEISGDIKPTTQLQKVERDGKVYLAAYTDPVYLPSKDEPLSNAVFSFNDLVRIIKNDPRYSGIIINQYDDDIVLDTKTLSIYIILRTMFSKKRLQGLLESLTDKEKEYLSDLSYKVIWAKEIEKQTKKQIINKFKITEKMFDKAEHRANYVLKNIIYARF